MPSIAEFPLKKLALKVSVIVPCYNHEKYIEECINSIIGQTYQDIELIVIDDGSTDRSPEILRRMSEKYGFYYEQQKNMGLPATLNKAIRIASGEYISPVASDDTFAPNKIELLMNEFLGLDGSYAVVCGDANFIDENSLVINQQNESTEPVSVVRHYIENSVSAKSFNLNEDFGKYESLLLFNCIPVLSTIIRKTALLEVGLYDENIHIEDWNMWLKLSQNYRFHYIDLPVANYRLHDYNSLKTSSYQLKVDMLKVLLREREYSYRHGYGEKWEYAYYSRLINIAYKYKPGIFLAYFRFSDTWRLMRVMSIKMRSKIGRLLKN